MKQWKPIKVYRGFEILCLDGAERGDDMDYRIRPQPDGVGASFELISDATKAIDEYLKTEKELME
jgi:hypothetical protein